MKIPSVGIGRSAESLRFMSREPKTCGVGEIAGIRRESERALRGERHLPFLLLGCALNRLEQDERDAGDVLAEMPPSSRRAQLMSLEAILLARLARREPEVDA
jgi:hypothetical protein